MHLHALVSEKYGVKILKLIDSVSNSTQPHQIPKTYKQSKTIGDK